MYINILIQFGYIISCFNIIQYISIYMMMGNKIKLSLLYIGRYQTVILISTAIYIICLYYIHIFYLYLFKCNKIKIIDWRF